MADIGEIMGNKTQLLFSWNVEVGGTEKQVNIGSPGARMGTSREHIGSTEKGSLPSHHNLKIR